MKSLRFQGTLETNGVSVSIPKQNTDTSRNSTKTKKTTKVDDDETKHIEKLSQTDLKNTVDRCALINPGRRDIMYCMKESSSVEEKQKPVFTKNNRTKRSRHFRSLRKRNMSPVVQEAESVFSRFESKLVNLEKVHKVHESKIVSRKKPCTNIMETKQRSLQELINLDLILISILTKGEICIMEACLLCEFAVSTLNQRTNLIISL